MSGVNKVILVGNLGANPEMRFTQGGQAVANLRLATSERWTDKSGQKQETTEWHRVVVFGKQAEIVGQYPDEGTPGLHRGPPADPAVAGSAGAEALHHRDRRPTRADVGRPRRAHARRIWAPPFRRTTPCPPTSAALRTTTSRSEAWGRKGFDGG